MKMKAEKALAIQYRKDFPAPIICAKGRGELARKLIGIAEKNGIQIMRDEKMTEGLFYLQPGELIPEEYYAAMAEMIAFVYRVRNIK